MTWNHGGTGYNRRETDGDRGDKCRQTWNHVGTGSNRRETNGDRPVIMLEQDPVEGRQRETNGDRPGIHEERGSSRREIKGDKGGKLEIMNTQHPAKKQRRQMETEPDSCWNMI